MNTAAELTDLQRAAIRRAARAELDAPGSWIRSVTAGDRVTLSSLETRGLLERRPWRGDGRSRDSAFEYRLAPRFRDELHRRADERAKLPRLAEVRL